MLRKFLRYIKNKITKLVNSFFRLANFVIKNWVKVLVLIALVYGAYYLWDLESSILWAVFFAFALFGWDNRKVGFVAIVFLVLCPLLIYLEAPKAAEQSAVYAYLFLCMTVFLQIIELIRHPEDFRE